MGDFRAFRPFRGLLHRSSAIVPPLTLRQQVEALGVGGSTGPRIALTSLNPASPPAGTTISGNAWNFATPGVSVSGIDSVGYRINVTASDVTITDCRVEDVGLFGSAAYPFEVDTTALRCVARYNEIVGSSSPRRVDLPQETAPGTAFVIKAADCIFEYNRVRDFPSDGGKVSGNNPTLRCNRIGPPRSKAAVAAWPAYDPEATYSYPLGGVADKVSYNGRGYTVRYENTTVMPGQAPSGDSGNNTYWQAVAPHVDLLTITQGIGGTVAFNVFEEGDSDAAFGLTQEIRVIRDTGKTQPIGPVKIYCNLFKPWDGAYPLDAGYMRPVTAQADWAAGSWAYQNGRFWQALVAIAGAANRPDLAPEKWVEFADTGAGEVLWFANWAARGSSGWYSGPSEYSGHLVFGANVYEDDGSPASPPNGAVIVDDLPLPSFGGALPYSHPPVAYTGAIAHITPSAYGKFKVGGEIIDACVIRCAGRVVCYFTPGANLSCQRMCPIPSWWCPVAQSSR